MRRAYLWTAPGLLVILAILVFLSAHPGRGSLPAHPGATAPGAALETPVPDDGGTRRQRPQPGLTPLPEADADATALAPAPAPAAAPDAITAPAARPASGARWPTTPETEAEVRALLALVAEAVRQQQFAQMDAVIAAIKEYGTAAIAPLLDVLGEDDGSRLPIYAAVILGEMETEHPDAALAAALRESALPRLEDLAAARDDPSLRHAALVALGKVGDPGSLDLLVDALARERGGLLGEQALRSLTALRGTEATETLATLAREEPDPGLRQSLAEALAAREDPAALAALEDLARNDYSEEVRLAAARGLAALPGPEADALLREIARGPESPSLRAAALGGLGAPGEERDLGLMEDALRFASANEVRTAAYKALERVGTAAARRVMEDYRPAARIDRVFRGSSAEASGLEAEDLVTEYDGEPVTDALEFKALVRATQPNRIVPLRLQRDGRTLSMAVTGGFLGVAIEDGVARN